MDTKLKLTLDSIERVQAAQNGLNQQLRSSLNASTYRASEMERSARTARHDLDQEKRHARDKIDALNQQIQNLKNQAQEALIIIGHQRDAIAERDRAIVERDNLLKSWVRSQTVFMGLFKNYATLTDGRRVVDLQPSERQKILSDAFAEFDAQELANQAQTSTKPV